MIRLFFILFCCHIALCRNFFEYDEAPLNCRPDEEVQCLQCPGEKTCRRPGDPGISCPAWINAPCYRQCACKDGRLRNRDGSCITDEECDSLKCPGAHENLECHGICDNACETIHRQNKTNCPSTPYRCIKQCYCEDGYARDEQNNCIPIEQCGPEKCKPYEVFQCIQKCPGEITCRNRDVEKECPDVVEDCVPKCVCKEGLFRADDGSCYDKEQCDKTLCPSENEFYDCGYNCDNVCGWSEQNRTNCPNTENTKCRPRCYCNDGFARNLYGTCILVEECEADLEHRRNRDPNLPPCCKISYGFPLDFENN